MSQNKTKKRLFWELTVTRLINKFLDFYGIRMFITVFTRADQWSLSWPAWINPHAHPISLRPILILSSHLSLGFPNQTKMLYAIISPMRATCSSHLILFELLNLTISEKYIRVSLVKKWQDVSNASVHYSMTLNKLQGYEVYNVMKLHLPVVYSK
jgi:hypothetical protein